MHASHRVRSRRAAASTFVAVAAGDPAVCLAEIPDCGCDACDRGSAELLREMDWWVLAVVDGSLQVDVAADGASIRSSFGGRGGTVQYLDQPTSFTAARGQRTGPRDRFRMSATDAGAAVRLNRHHLLVGSVRRAAPGAHVLITG
ncbi:DUF6226 family protein [Rhodococcus sp. (in: high G+C Gram-positive bacteria)]|uniref:DUF6226 family protein n=1 Tax=Rhodococcus sp. TaxID=1831 RepID=UPI003B8A8FAB